MPSSDPFSYTFMSVWEEIKDIMDKMNAVITKLDAEIIKLCKEEAPNADEDTAPCTKQQVKEADEEPGDSPGDTDYHSSPHDPPESDSGLKQEVDNGGDQRLPHSQTRVDSEAMSASGDGVEIEQGEEVEGQVTNDQTDFLEEAREDVEDKEDKGTNTKWVTVG